MIVSNASPIQFWINGVPTFNEKVNPGVQSVPYKYKFQLTDVIRIQILDPDEEGLTLNLCVYDCDGERVALQALTDFGGYYETTFTFSTLSLDEGLYRVQIETNFSMGAGTGIFTLNGQDAALGGQSGMTGVFGSFTLTGQNVTLEFVVATIDVQAELTTGFSSTFQVSFNGAATLTLVGSGSSDASTIPNSSNVEASVGKLTNGGLASDVVIVVFKKNGATMFTGSINGGDPVGSDPDAIYTYTGVTADDTLTVSIMEG